MKKIFIFLCMLILTINIASAITTDELMYYWSFDINYTDAMIADNLLLGRGARGIDVLYRYGNGSVNGSNYLMAINDTSRLPIGANNRTISIWFNATQADSSNSGFWAYWGTWETKKYLYSYYSSARQIYIAYQDPNNACGDAGLFNFNEWSHYVVTYDGVTLRGWLNKNPICNISVNDLNTDVGLVGSIGGITGDSDDYFGSLDEVYIYNRTLSATEIIELYDGSSPFGANTLIVNWDNTTVYTENVSFTYTYNVTGSNLSYANCSLVWNGTTIESQNNRIANTSYSFISTVTPPIDYNVSAYIECNGSNGIYANSTNKSVHFNVSINSFSVTAKNNWSTATLNTFSVLIGGDMYNTTNGTVYTPYNSTNSEIINMTIITPNHYNVSVINHNTSTNYEANPYQAIVRIRARELYSSNYINSFKLQTEKANYTAVDNLITIYPNITTYTWNFSHDEYYNETGLSFNVQNNSIDLTINNMYDKYININDNDTSLAIYPTCFVGIFGEMTSQYKTVVHDGNTNMSCSLTGYKPRNFTLNSTYPQNETIVMDASELYIMFINDSGHANTSGYIETPDLGIYFNETPVIEEMYEIAEGYVTVTFNPDDEGNYQQSIAYYNDNVTEIRQYVYLDEPDLAQKVNVFADGSPIANSRVCDYRLANNPDTSTVEWMITYCAFTDDNGEVTLLINDQNTHKFCAQADGYTTTCIQKYVIPSNTDIFIITLSSGNENDGFNYAASTCGRYISTAANCTLEVTTYKPYTSICFNYTSTLSNGYTCGSDINTKTLDYLITVYDPNWTIQIFLDGEPFKNITNTFFDYNESILIDFEQEDDEGNSMIDKLNSDLTYLITFYILMIIIGAFLGWVAEKYYEGYGIYGSGVFFIVLTYAGFWVFAVGAVPIVYHFILNQIIPWLKTI